jgi:hypothetical protein
MSDQEALRDEIAQAIHRRRCCDNVTEGWHFYRDHADAVLPVLQRRETALVEKIQALADEFDAECDKHRGRVLLAKTDEDGLAAIVMAGATLDAARRLRSILPTQGEPQ